MQYCTLWYLFIFRAEVGEFARASARLVRKSTNQLIFIAGPLRVQSMVCKFFNSVLLEDFFTSIQAFLSSLRSFLILINIVIRQETRRKQRLDWPSCRRGWWTCWARPPWAGCSSRPASRPAWWRPSRGETAAGPPPLHGVSYSQQSCGQCCGSGSSGSTCFLASWIRIH